MQGKLRMQIETERAQAAENARVRVALDNVSSNVMVADENFDVIYTNPAFDQMLRDAEADIRKDLPAFNAASATRRERRRALEEPGAGPPRTREPARHAYDAGLARQAHVPPRRQPGDDGDRRPRRHGVRMDGSHAGSGGRGRDAEHALRGARPATSSGASPRGQERLLRGDEPRRQPARRQHVGDRAPREAGVRRSAPRRRGDLRRATPTSRSAPKSSPPRSRRPPPRWKR